MSQLLSPETEALIQERIDGERYRDADAVVRAALRLLEEREKLAALRALIDEGLAEIERGEVIDWTPDLMDRLIAEADEETRRGVPVSDAVKP